MTVDAIREKIISILKEYPVNKVLLFGSRADGTNREDSDVDLIVEFSEPVSLLTLSDMRVRLSEVLNLDVDLIHGPIRDTDLLEIEKVIELYAA